MVPVGDNPKERVHDQAVILKRKGNSHSSWANRAHESSSRVSSNTWPTDARGNRFGAGPSVLAGVGGDRPLAL